MTIKLGLIGCAGRMGRAITATIAADPESALVAALEQPGRGAIGRDAGVIAGGDALGIAVGDDAEALFATEGLRAVIEFSSPTATVEHGALAARAGVAYVTGTTGLNAAQEMGLEEVAKHVPVVYAANMSLGVNLLMALVEQAATRLGPDYDIEILEMHHNKKVDAPSGTALALGRAAARGRVVALDAVSSGLDGDRRGGRERGDIGFAVLRGGDVAGDHSVIFAAQGERLELSHRASDRGVFAQGAVAAAKWAAAQGREPGLYAMKDVLAL